MNAVNFVATGLGYLVMIAVVIVFVVGIILQIKDKRAEIKSNSVTEAEARINVRLANIGNELECHSNEIDELHAQINAIEDIVDQFRPAPEYRHEKPQQEGDAS